VQTTHGVQHPIVHSYAMVPQGPALENVTLETHSVTVWILNRVTLMQCGLEAILVALPVMIAQAALVSVL
jgi:hypothetical protein